MTTKMMTTMTMSDDEDDDDDNDEDDDEDDDDDNDDENVANIDGLFDKADNNNGFFGLTLIITLFGVSIFCDLLHQTF